MDLEQIGFISGTDKSKIEHDFLDFYQRELSRFQDSQITLIEIGVKEGASLRMWATWLPKAQVVGLDIDARADNFRKLDNMRVRIGDASDPAVLTSLVVDYGNPTIVVDDGSHFWQHQIICLQNLWPTIKAGGCFIMEDIHTSFPALTDEYRRGGAISGFDYLHKLNRWVVGNRFMAMEEAYDDFIAATWPTIESMHFFRGTCLIWKKY